MTMSAPAPTAPLDFHDLQYGGDGGDDVVVGRPDVDSFGVFPADGASLLRRLQDGLSPADAAAWYESTYDEPIDMDAFVATLHELDFVRVAGSSQNATRPLRWQRLARALFSPAGALAYAALLVAAVVVAARHPEVAPSYSHVLFAPSLIVVELTVVLGQIPMSLLHELAHVLAARRRGVRSRLRVAQRLHFVVFETVLDGLVLLPRRQRYLPMLAGMLADVGAMAALTLAAFALRRPDGTMPLAGGVCLALAVTTLPRLLWQFYFFLRTDIYYLVVTVFDCTDLHGATRAVLANTWRRWRGRGDRAVSLDAFDGRDRQAARWYAPVMVAGYAVSLATLVLVMAPLAWQFFGTAARRLLSGEAGPGAAWDAAGLLALNLAQVVLAAVLGRRDRHRSTPQEAVA
jgi:hypothetical protein